MRPPSTLSLRNRQTCRPIQLPLLRRITRTLLTELLPPQTFDLCVHLVALPEITQLNQTYLRHPGPTDVITFDHQDPDEPSRIYGEIFLCVETAVRQARQFRTSWQAEVVRYVVHGLLHLYGYDDRYPRERQRMKVTENRLCRQLFTRFHLSKLGVDSKVSV